MRKIVLFFPLLLLLAAAVSCGSKRRDADYYEQKIDSIRKAEQIKKLQLQSGIGREDPLQAFFDTLRYHTLPVKSERSDFSRIGAMTAVPKLLNGHFGYEPSDELKALLLPHSHRHRVMLLAEMQDSVTPVLYLYTLKPNLHAQDMLCIYEQKDADREDDFGKTYTEFFITSDYEITLMEYYLSHDATQPELFQARRYRISKEGKFEEVMLEL